ncbi:amidase [Jeotgalibacillus haloalkalitolerans]|uniref:Amidase n=1 Tax=Jeotgalibacillus haloalkalitolerans TaxID=3104292 RepID=A0ABU5KMA2_9BACL|nr:amidase [Jeotgalibacillus sp. HH7-29]MDZ5711840.1 amidase [Jeotgalibacillus sp. HH7-29]
MKKEEYMRYDATGLAGLIKSKNISVREAVETAVNVINDENPRVNAVTHLRLEKAMTEAEKANMNTPFGGVPILLKDMSQNVKGSPATAGSNLLKSNLALKNSYFTDKLIQAGFIVLGHTNAPEFGLKNITEPLLHGASRNPLNVNHSPGGSSGGAAAAVASGMVPVAGASDGGGSIRIPASFSGLIGLKPTRGRMPVGPGTGRQWQGAAIDFFLTKSVRDTAGLLDCMQIYQRAAAYHTPLFSKGYLNTLEMKNNFRVAYSFHSPVGTLVSPDAEQAVLKTVDMLQAEGFQCEEAAPPIDGKELMRQYYMMNSGEMAALVSSLEKSFNRKLTIEDVEIESWALYQAGLKCSAGDFSRSLSAWDQASAIMHEFHQRYDLYITPAAAHTAPLIGQLRHQEAMQNSLEHIHLMKAQDQQELIYQMFEPSLTLTPYTQLANLTGQPAISLPLYTAENGLPIGIQLMAPKGNEHWLLSVSNILMKTN